MDILTASWVLPVAGPPLRDGRVAADGGRIVWVGCAGEAGEPNASLRDLGPGVLLPGLINAHCHLELSHLRGLAAGGGFVPWVEALVAQRGSASLEERRSAVRDALAGLGAHGTVAIGDVSNDLEHLDLLAGSDLQAVVFLELMAWDPARVERTLAFAAERLDQVRHAVRPGLRVALAAHAPHSVSGEAIRRLAERGELAAIHLAESQSESRFMAEGGGDWAEFLCERGLGHVEWHGAGCNPVAYLDGLGALRPGLLAAHCVQTGPEEWRLLAERGVRVVSCPRSNRALGVGQAPLKGMIESGVEVCLGTDSLASAPDLDLLAEMRLVAEQQPAIDPARIVEMATKAGARALDLADLGTLEVGKAARFAFAAAPTPPESPYEWLFAPEATLSGLRA